MNDLQEPPKTVKEVGIHLFYVSKNVTDLTDLVKKLQSGFVPIKDFDDHKAQEALEHAALKDQLDDFKRNIKWLVAMIIGTATVVVTFFHK